MQPRELCCCQSAGFRGMLGCKWAADRDRKKKKRRQRLIAAAEASHLIKSILTETTERVASMEFKKWDTRLVLAAG